VKELRKETTEFESKELTRDGASEKRRDRFNNLIKAVSNQIPNGNNQDEKNTLAAYYMMGKILGKSVDWVLVDNEVTKTYTVIPKMIEAQSNFWTNISSGLTGRAKVFPRSKAKLKKVEYQFVYALINDSTNKLVKDIFPAESPAAGSGLKKISAGRKTIKSVTNQINDLYHAYELGNKSKLVKDQIKSNLEFLHKKNKVGKDYLDAVFKKLKL